MIDNNIFLIIITTIIGFSGVSVITLWKEDILKFNSILKGISVFVFFTLMIGTLYSIIIFIIYKLYLILFLGQNLI